jgi:hypothetical protein
MFISNLLVCYGARDANLRLGRNCARERKQELFTIAHAVRRNVHHSSRSAEVRSCRSAECEHNRLSECAITDSFHPAAGLILKWAEEEQA